MPFAIKEKVGSELDRLEEAGVLCKVEYSEWAASILPVPKKDGSLRLCWDYKVTVNPALNVDQYSLPKPADLLSSLAGGQRFSKLDLTSAYQQVPLDEISVKLTTINTHQRLYDYTCLPFGVASAPTVFQKIMDTILQGISSVICYLYDILITGRNEVEHLRNLEEVLRRLQEHGVRLHKEHGVKLHKEKCLFFQESVEYLDPVWTVEASTPQKMVKAIFVLSFCLIWHPCFTLFTCCSELNSCGIGRRHANRPFKKPREAGRSVQFWHTTIQSSP